MLKIQPEDTMYAVSLRVDIVEFLCFGRKEAGKYE